jgi:hypothetical protein
MMSMATQPWLNGAWQAMRRQVNAPAVGGAILVMAGMIPLVGQFRLLHHFFRRVGRRVVTCRLIASHGASPQTLSGDTDERPDLPDRSIICKIHPANP